MLETTKHYPHRGEAKPHATCDTNMNDYENQTKKFKKLFLSIKIATAQWVSFNPSCCNPHASSKRVSERNYTHRGEMTAVNIV